MSTGKRRDPIDVLDEASIVSKAALSDLMIGYINTLTDDEVAALLSIHKKVGNLGVFFDGIVPQTGKP